MRFLLSLLSPSLCIACRADARWRPPLCADCRSAMRPGGRVPIGAACAAGPLPAGRPVAVECWAAFAYDGPAGALVRALKFDGRVGIADAMAAQIAASAPPELLAGTVVPVPVHPDHRRRRGVDHAAALGRALARRAGLEFSPCLERRGDPLPQVGRGRRERIRGPRGAIRLRPEFEAPPTALIVDDVVTTGATIGACIRVLVHAGCQEIATITYARTTAR